MLICVGLSGCGYGSFRDVSQEADRGHERDGAAHSVGQAGPAHDRRQECTYDVSSSPCVFADVYTLVLGIGEPADEGSTLLPAA